jgi:hypothetical protein
MPSIVFDTPTSLAYFADAPDIQPKTIQLFPQMFALEGHAMKRFMLDLSVYLRPKTFVITLRYTDWWYWEQNAPLRIRSDWMKDIKVPRSMEQLVMEFETRNGKRDELDAIVSKQISTWKFAIENKVVKAPDGELVTSCENEFLVHDGGKPVATTWVGFAKVGGANYAHHAPDLNGNPDGLGKDEMLYYVVTMVWRREGAVVGRNSRRL